MKKKIVIILLFSLTFLTACIFRPSTPNSGLETVSLQLHWIPQAQFAGYYMALEKGWYRAEGINLVIKHGGPELAVIDEVSGGKSDFGTAFLADLSIAVQKGKAVISIGQIQQMNGLLLVTKKSSGIRRPADFAGKRIGVWGSSWEAQLNALLARENIPRKDVKITPQGFGMQMFLAGELDVASAMVYNEYHTLLESGLQPKDMNIIDYTMYGLGFPGDVLFTNRLMTQEKPELCSRLLKASLRGWQYAIENPREAVDIVLKASKSSIFDRDHQLSMMREIAGLVKVSWQQIGYTDPSAIQQMVDILYRYEVLQAKIQPGEVYTNSIWEQAQTE